MPRCPKDFHKYKISDFIRKTMIIFQKSLNCWAFARDYECQCFISVLVQKPFVGDFSELGRGGCGDAVAIGRCVWTSVLPHFRDDCYSCCTRLRWRHFVVVGMTESEKRRNIYKKKSYHTFLFLLPNHLHMYAVGLHVYTCGYDYIYGIIGVLKCVFFPLTCAPLRIFSVKFYF